MKQKAQDSIVFKKICVLGNLQVGNHRFIELCPDTEAPFSPSYLSTIGLRIFRKNFVVNLERGQQKVYLIIWDIENKPQFYSLLPGYLKGAKGVIIMGDLSRPKTLDSISWQLDFFGKINPQSVAIIILYKSDLVSQEELELLMKKYNFNHYEQVTATYITSSKSNHEINQIFYQLAQEIC